MAITSYLLTCEAIFVNLLTSHDMQIVVVPLKLNGELERKTTIVKNYNVKISDDSPETKYRKWLHDCYNEVFELILDCFEYERQTEAHQALTTSFKLLAMEGLHPIEDELQHQPFPILQLNKIISKLLLSECLMKNVIIRLSDYAIYDDFCYYAWKLVMKNLIPSNKSDLNATFIQNFFELLNVLIPVTSKNVSEEKQFLCKSVTMEPALLRKNVNRVWNVIVQWPHGDVTHRQLLVLLLEKILGYLEKPTMLTDYLMDSLDVGGQISLLALQGIFVLIHKHNMSYPNIYEKLYMMFEPEIFHMKFKPRLFHLADIFLTSSYLPETLVAAFVKRLARLALIAPPQDVIIVIYFIGNLIIRHPGLKRLICDKNSSGAVEIAEDPFVMDEADPNKSQALQSSLWEIQMLRNHMLPNVAQAAKNIMTQPLPGREWDLGNYLELKENDVSLKLSFILV